MHPPRFVRALARFRARRQTVRTAKAVLVDAAGNTLVLRRSLTHGSRPRQPDLPGGRVSRGELPATAAAREIAEETGLTIDPGQLELVFSGRRWPKPRLRVLYRARLAETAPTVTVSAEHSGAEWVTPSQFDELAKAMPTFYRNALQRLHP